MTMVNIRPQKAVRPVSTVEAATVTLRSAISDGTLKPGDRIKEFPVAEALGLSRGAVREALRALAEEGLVDLAVNQGASVAEIHAADLLELYAIRLSLGNLALRRLCTRPTDLTEVFAALDRLASAARRNQVKRAVSADHELQDSLVRAAALPRTAKLFERTTVQLDVYVGVVRADYRSELTTMHDDDAELVALVAASDLKGALRAWHHKLDHWVRHFITHLDEHFDAGEWLEVYGPE